ncbi:MAG: four helix bundle protein [Chitinophagales bacterium]|nr:four helix bundle protein [Chitinophagales bacterium]
MEEGFEEFEVNEEGKPYNIRHRAFYFSRDVIEFVKKSSYEKVFYSIYDQLVRSATSVGANLAEGKAGSTRKDWKNYFLIALKSANETKYWLCLIRDTMDQTDKKKIIELITEADEISNIIASIIVKAG